MRFIYSLQFAIGMVVAGCALLYLGDVVPKHTWSNPLVILGLFILILIITLMRIRFKPFTHSVIVGTLFCYASWIVLINKFSLPNRFLPYLIAFAGLFGFALMYRVERTSNIKNSNNDSSQKGE